MSDLRQETVDTYNKSAKELAAYFQGIGSRVKDIDLAFEAAGNPERARVVEIGCGDGRDAKEIVGRCSFYEGFDISEELIKLAQQHVPAATFTVADASSYRFAKDLDVVFAFASLLHLDKQEVEAVLQRVHAALKPGGIFYISLKWAPEYTSSIKEDQFGRRLFYFYNADVIRELAGDAYEVVDTFRETRGKTEWFEMILRKPIQ